MRVSLLLVLCLGNCLVKSTDDVLLVPSYIQDELNSVVCLENCTKYQVENCNCQPEQYKKEWIISPVNILQEPTLVCREDSMLTFQVDNSDNLTYIFEYKSKYDDNWYFFDSSSQNILTLKYLEPNSEYKIRIWGVSEREELFGPRESHWVTTLKQDYVPRVVTKLWLQNLTMIDDDYTAIIQWNPSIDKSCYYEFVWFGGDDISDYTQKEIKDPSTLYELKLGRLQYDSNYSIAVMTKSSDWKRESEKTWLHFNTQPCLDIYDDLNFCPPPTPEGLKIESYEVANVLNGNYKLYNIVLTWNKPKLQPDSYAAVFRSIIFKTNNSVSYKNASGDATKLFFENVDIGAHFQISLTAYSSAGSSLPAVILQESFLEILENNTFPITFIAITVIGLFIALVISITYLCKKREKPLHVEELVEEVELKSLYEESMYFDDNTELVENYKDNWEIDYCNLHLLSILGQGAFGVVRKAVLLKGETKMDVAVKMLRDETVGEEVHQFKQEIDILKSVGKHPHIVSMVGCCTKGPVGPFLVVEYCGKGDLLSYLRNICENMKFGEIYNSSPSGEAEDSCGINFINQSYQITMNNQDVEVLEVKDLLSIGRQVATGMEYLSSVKVVHRDLAARNVLICNDNTVKVSDFGLSRDVYRDNVYCKLGAGKLPLRWMAIESLTHQRYTTKSDVWSFGILLWEIFTLGGNPYPNIGDTYGLLESLKAGERMSRPENCSQETYNLMLKCWKEHPKDRPNFTEVKRYLESLLENTVDYLDLCFGETALEDFSKEKSNENILETENHYIIP